LAPARRPHPRTARQPRRHHGGRHPRAGEHLRHRRQRRVSRRRDPNHDRLWQSENAARRVPEPYGADVPPARRRRHRSERYSSMTMRANPTLIGAFVLGASILFAAGLLLWGGTGIFKTKHRYVMYFETAVTGLQKGSPVLVKGVRVGEVTDVQVRWGTSLVGVYVRLEPDVLKGVRPSDIDAAVENAISTRGLRAQLR